MRDGNRQSVLFSSTLSRRVEVVFDEPSATSDGGALLLRALELVRQRVFGIACGYVDGNDARRMNGDPMQWLLCESSGDLASQPTLSRFENQASRTSLWRMGVALMESVIAAQQRRHRNAPP